MKWVVAKVEWVDGVMGTDRHDRWSCSGEEMEYLDSWVLELRRDFHVFPSVRLWEHGKGIELFRVSDPARTGLEQYYDGHWQEWPDFERLSFLQLERRGLARVFSSEEAAREYAEWLVRFHEFLSR